MKFLKIATKSVLLSVILNSFAWAGSKPALDIDFNNLIEDGMEQKAEIHQKLTESMAETSVESERKMVMDFVDIEIGWGEIPPVVDRRFDNYGKPAPLTVEVSDIESGSRQPNSVGPVEITKPSVDTSKESTQFKLYLFRKI